MKQPPDGKPDLAIAGFSLWALGRPHPDAENGWDEAYVNVYAVVEVESARVEIDDGFVSMALERFCTELAALDRSLAGSASFQGEWFSLSFDARSLGHVEFEVTLYDGHPTHQHRFTFEVDQTHVRAFLGQVRDLLDLYPVPPRYAAPKGN